VAGARPAGVQLLPPILACQKIFFVRKLSPKNAKFAAENYPFWGNLEAQLRF